jgi:hypothetical protein
MQKIFQDHKRDLEGWLMRTDGGGLVPYPYQVIFLCTIPYFIRHCSSAAPQISLCGRMLGLNLGMLRPVATFALAVRRSYNSLELIHTFFMLYNIE